MQTTPHKRNAEIEFLRFFMASIVVFFHQTHTFLPRGLLAVEFFFILSGYLLAMSLNKIKGEDFTFISQGLFLKRKIASFYPELIIASLLGCFGHLYKIAILNSDWLGFGSSCIKNILQNLLLLRMTGIVGMTAPCAPAWYLSSMLIAFIILLPFLLKCRNPLLRLVVSLWLYGLVIHHMGGLEKQSFDDWVFFTYGGNLRAIAGILLGTVAYDTVRLCAAFKLSSIQRFGLSLLQLALLIAFCSICFLHAKAFDGLAVCLHFFIIIICFSRQSLFCPLLNHSLLYSCCCILGKFSLPLYLGHFYARFVFTKLDERYDLNAIWYFAMACILGLLVALGACFIRRWILRPATTKTA